MPPNTFLKAQQQQQKNNVDPGETPQLFWSLQKCVFLEP